MEDMVAIRLIAIILVTEHYFKLVPKTSNNLTSIKNNTRSEYITSTSATFSPQTKDLQHYKKNIPEDKRSIYVIGSEPHRGFWE